MHHTTEGATGDGVIPGKLQGGEGGWDGEARESADLILEAGRDGLEEAVADEVGGGEVKSAYDVWAEDTTQERERECSSPHPVLWPLHTSVVLSHTGPPHVYIHIYIYIYTYIYMYIYIYI